ncbi:hypothetical protein J6590_076940 [Homalodisca vitripennis]|nr:hypothetical protein J6590_076940 [Homalodisca vitripennis]
MEQLFTRGAIFPCYTSTIGCHVTFCDLPLARASAAPSAANVNAEVNERKTSLMIRTLTISVLADRAEQQQQKVVEPGIRVGIFGLEKELYRLSDKMDTPDTITRDLRPVFSLLTVTNNFRTWQNPFFNYVKQTVPIALLNRNKEGISALPFDSPKNPLSLNSSAAIDRQFSSTSLKYDGKEIQFAAEVIPVHHTICKNAKLQRNIALSPWL